MSFWRNQFKTFMGWLVGIPLLALTRTLNPVLVSTILCVFYAFFYTFLDALLKHVETYLSDLKNNRHTEFWRGLY